MISAINYSRMNHYLQVWVPFLLAASLLAVPISSTAKSIFVSLALVLIILTPAYRHDLVSTIYQPWCQALLLLFFIAVLACGWGPASAYQKFAVLQKYIKLLFLPLLVVGFRDPRARRYGLYAFLIAMSITCLLSMLKEFGLLSFNGPDPGKVFYNHIITGFMMAFAAYLSALMFIRERGRVRILYASLVMLFSYQALFIGTSRTGYIIYVLLMILLIVQVLQWKKALIAVVLGCSLFTLSYYQNPTMQFVVKETVANMHEIHQGQKDNNIGYRIQFHDFAKKLWLRHPWFGNGTGSYTYYFREENPVPAWRKPKVPLASLPKKMLEPHSQYWFVATEWGIVGLIALLIFFGTLLVASLRLHSMRAVAIALMLPFMLGNFSDSLLYYSGPGYFFLLFMAMCLGENVARGSR